MAKTKPEKEDDDGMDVEFWAKRIRVARQRREQMEVTWAEYAALHAKARQWIATQDVNDDDGVLLPNGDQVRLSLVHRNIEQTLAMLEAPEIGVRVTIMDDVRELTTDDTSREAVVEVALQNSAKRSGLIKGAEIVDAVKRDGLIIGHGVAFSWYRMEEREVEVERIAIMREDEAGQIVPMLDEESGEPAMDVKREKQVIWQGVQDEHVPVLEFLFDARAMRMDKACWHGREQIVPLEGLREDSRYTVPDDLEPSSFTVKDLYGLNQDGTTQNLDADYVRKITIWDKHEKMLYTFIEAPKRKANTNKTQQQLLLIGSEHWPVTFSHPDDSPFSFFIPIPANDIPWGVSQVEHIRNQAVEGDKLRTRQANLTRQIKRIMVARKGMVDADQFQTAVKSPDMGLVEMDLPDDFDRNRDIFELPMPRMNPELLQQQAAAESDIDKTSGISAVPFGGAATATESANMMAVGGARPNRKRRLYFKFLEDVLGKHRDYLREFGPDGQRVTVPGPDGIPITTVYGREAFAGEIDIEVQASGELAISPVRQKMLIEVANMVKGQFGPAFDTLFLADMLAEFNFRGRNRLMAAAGRMLQQGMAPPPGGGTVPLPSGFNPEEYNDGATLRAAVNPNE